MSGAPQEHCFRRPTTLNELGEDLIAAGVDELDRLLCQSVEGVHPRGRPVSSRRSSVRACVRHLRREDKLELVGEIRIGAEVSAGKLLEKGPSTSIASCDIVTHF